MENKEKVYSYSRLGCFEGCKYSYFLNYVLDKEKLAEMGIVKKDNIYSFLGGKTHEILEDLQQHKIDTESAVRIFKDAVDEAEFLGHKWISEKVKHNYCESIVHYLENWQEIPGQCELEKEFLIEIDGIKIRGFIDILSRQGNVVDIFDYKTSSKFTKRDLPEYGRQLVLYALAVQQIYPEVEIGTIAWHMLKYAKVGRKVELRADVDLLAEFEPFVQEYVYNEETIQDLKDYVKTRVEEIESLSNNEEDYPPKVDYFFCSKLCDFGDCCKYFNS